MRSLLRRADARLPAAGLWRHPDFLKLWAGSAVSRLGSQVTLLALPLVAIVTLGAGPVEVGLLATAGGLPPLLFGLAAGVWVDRVRRRPLLIAADLGSGLVLLAVPAGAALGVLTVGHLYAVAFLTASLKLVSHLAAAPYLPGLVGPERLVEANSRLALSRTAAQVAGPGLAGALVQSLTAPFAVLADAASFFVSAAALALIRSGEPRPDPPAGGHRFWPELRGGLALVLGHRLLRPLVGATALLSFWNNALEAVWLLYLTRELGLPPGLLGAVLAVGNTGFLLGALTVRRAAARLGVGATLIGGLAAAALADLATPLVGYLPRAAGPLPTVGGLMAAQVVFGLGVIAFNVGSTSLLQGAAPDGMRARMAGATEFLTGSVSPLGALAGGAVGAAIGLQATLFVAVAGELSAALWLLSSPLRRMRAVPSSGDDR